MARGLNRKYVGRRSRDGLAVYVVDENGEAPLAPRLDLMNHSPTGFECGYEGSGPAQLALAILADHLLWSRELPDNRPLPVPTPAEVECTAVHWHQWFKRDVIARLPRDRDFEIVPFQIAYWVGVHAAKMFSGERGIGD